MDNCKLFYGQSTCYPSNIVIMFVPRSIKNKHDNKRKKECCVVYKGAWDFSKISNVKILAGYN